MTNMIHLDFDRWCRRRASVAPKIALFYSIIRLGVPGSLGSVPVIVLIIRGRHGRPPLSLGKGVSYGVDQRTRLFAMKDERGRCTQRLDARGHLLR